MTGRSVVIDAAHNGPPGSAHGGVTVGRLAELLGEGPAEVRLLAPPPLDTPMIARQKDHHDPGAGIVVAADGAEVATVVAMPQDVAVTGFALLGPDEIDEAAEQYLDLVTGTGHAFPTCFGCGPDRGDDALRQFTGVGSDGDTLARFRVAGEGPLPDWLTIAGLDCPSGWTVSMLENPVPEAVVLASMECQVHEPAHAGVNYQVRGRLLSSDGRKHSTEVAMLDPAGGCVAAARTLWIEVDPAVFNA